MKRSPLLLSVAAACLLGLPGAAVAKTPAKTTYLALGDSLGASWQPKAGGGGHVTTEGYVERLAARAKVKAVRYACPGESTTSMLNGGVDCGIALPYTHTSAKTSQMAAAEKYLRKNKHKIAFITVSIGANDVASCAKADGIDGACLTKGLTAIKKNLPKIAKRLRVAAGPKARIAVQTEYDPFLQFWLKGDEGSKSLASASVFIAKSQVNDAIIKGVKAAKLKVADVATAFDTYTPFEQTTTLDPYGTVPVAVAQICKLTWMCSGPNGPDIHANAAGYQVIADTFAKALHL
jgi:lysophospholipase L1-like esterase